MNTQAKTKKRRDLLPDEQRAADNLKAIWKAKKKALGFKRQDDLIEFCPEGWNQSTISNHMNGAYPISLRAVRVYTKLLKINDPAEIASDAIREVLADISESVAPTMNSDDFIMVPLSGDEKVSGGPGSVNEGPADEYNQKTIAFHRSFAEARGIPEGALRSTRVSGDSMADNISDGDIVTGRTDRLDKIRTNTIYSFFYNGFEHVKRIHVDESTGIISLNSDNLIRGDGFPVLITPEHADEFKLKAEIFHRAGYVS